jgi:hypothetical protein
VRVPHQEYHFTVGSLPHGVNPDKPCWPWKDEEPEPEPRLSIWMRLLLWVAWWR